MSEKNDGIGSIAADLDTIYDDIPGQYIDDVLKSDLPGSHLDQLIYGELPGSHLDVVLKSPLPGGSTDEILHSQIPAAGFGYGPVSDLHDHQGYGEGRPSGSKDAFLQKRIERQNEKNRREFIDDMENTSRQEARASQNRIGAASRRGLNDLDSLISVIKKNVEENRKERMRASATASTPVSRSKGSSKFVKSQIRKEKPKKKLGGGAIFIIFLILINLLNRVIVPTYNKFNTVWKEREKTASDNKIEVKSGSGKLELTESEYDSLVNISHSISEAFDDWDEYFEMSDEEFTEAFEKAGYSMKADKDLKFLFGSYVDGATWVNVSRSDGYVDFSCSSTSDSVDLAVIDSALTDLAPDYVAESIGQDISEIGLEPELLDKFYEAANSEGIVYCETDDYSIQFSIYDDCSAIYMSGNDEQTYFSVNKEGNWLKQITIWK